MFSNEFQNFLFRTFFTTILRRCFALSSGIMVLFFLAGINCYAQTPCLNLYCDKLYFEIVPKYPGLDETCTIPPGCSNPARQMVYSVYVVYDQAINSNDSLANGFFLDYRNLSVAVTMEATNPLVSPKSRINNAATQSCNEQHLLQWTDEIFKIESSPTVVTLDLGEDNNAGCPDNAVFMTIPPLSFGATPKAQSFLFDVVVDAYPGDTIKMLFSYINYNPEMGTDCGMSLTSEPGTNPTSNLDSVSIHMPTPYPVPSPVASIGLNANVKAKLGTPVIVGNTATIPVLLENVDNLFPVAVDYFEFVALLQLDQFVYLPSITSQFYSNIVQNGNNISCYFQNSTETTVNIAEGGTFLVGTIILPGPQLENLCWGGRATLLSDGSARISTANNCISNLAVETSFKLFNPTNCQQSCGPDSRLGFTVTTDTDLPSCSMSISLGLADLGIPSPPLGITAFEVVLHYNSTGDVIASAYSAGEYESSPTQSFGTFTNSVFAYQAYWDIGDPKEIYFNPGDQIKLNFTGTGCVSNVVITRLKVTYIDPTGQPQTITCIPLFDYANMPDGVCSPAIRGKITAAGAPPSALGLGVEDAEVALNGTYCKPNPVCADALFTNAMGEYGFCSCSCDTITIRPKLELDPLNGVNTWDLILISRHILNLEPLNSPYKIINADANKSGTVTTFDIVELRKLILGTYPNLPDNSSWRFVDATQVFTNPANPFSNVIREEFSGNLSQHPTGFIDFIGCKIGDVDYTATPNNRPSRPTTSLAWPTIGALNAEENVTVPIIYQGAASIAGIQFALDFDPSAWELISPSLGDITSVESSNLGLSKVDQGKITFSWNVFNEETEDLKSGDVLFYLTFKAKNKQVAENNLLALDYNTMPDGAWTHAGVEHALNHTPVVRGRNSIEDETTTFVRSIPNPTKQSSTLYFHNEQAGKSRLVLMDAWGRQLLFKDIFTNTGHQQIPLDTLNTQPAGVYSWWLKLPNGVQYQGRIVKQ